MTNKEFANQEIRNARQTVDHAVYENKISFNTGAMYQDQLDCFQQTVNSKGVSEKTLQGVGIEAHEIAGRAVGINHNYRK